MLKQILAQLLIFLKFGIGANIRTLYFAGIGLLFLIGLYYAYLNLGQLAMIGIILISGGLFIAFLIRKFGIAMLLILPGLILIAIDFM